MKMLCRLILLATAAFSTATVPLVPSITGRHVSTFGTKKATSITNLKLSQASVGGLLLRGGGGECAAGDLVLQNFHGEAAGFFDGIRTPATFLAGSSLAAIFTLSGAARKLYADEEKVEMNRLERAAVKFYHLVSLSAFVLSLNTIMTATSAYTSILHGRFDPMAETAYLLLKREFEYEFVSCRWSFLASTFCFLGIVTSRMLIEFDLLKDSDGKKRDMRLMVVCAMLGLATHLMSYINQNLYCWDTLIGMGLHFGKLILKRAFVDHRPLEILSVLLALTSTVYVGKIIVEEHLENQA